MTPEGVLAVRLALRTVVLLSVLLVLVAVASRWWRTREAPTGWVLLMFGCLGWLLVASLLPPVDGTVLGALLSRSILLTLVLVPHMLLRYVHSLGAVGRRSLLVGTALTAVAVAGSLLLPSMPPDGAPRPAWLWGYLTAMLLGWVVQSVLAARGLVLAARHQTTVVRRRLHLLGAGSITLVVALLLLVLVRPGGEPVSSASALVVPFIGLLGVGMFVLSFLLPGWLRTLWVQGALDGLGGAQIALLSAENPRQVAEILVPQLPEILGGGEAVMLDVDGQPLSATDMSAVDLAALVTLPRAASLIGAHAEMVRPGLLGLGMARGWLAVRTNPFSVPFTTSDIGLFAHVAFLADVTMERIERAELQDAARLQLERSVGELRTSREELEVARDEALEANRLKSEFLANMSHEIRTPMNGVIGMTALLLDTDLDAEQHDYADTVRFSAEALLTVIDDILDFSKIEAGMLEVEEIDHDLVAVVEEAAGLLAGPAEAKGLSMRCSIDPQLPPVLRGDPGRIRQILVNLLGNAVKFTQVGEVGVDVRVLPSAADRTEVELTVHDTGIGIEPEQLDRLFEGFTQADTSTTRRFGGTGLGLSISRQLTELMGGTLTVRSRPSVGSTFTARLTFARSSAVPAGGSALAGGRVLVIHDGPSGARGLPALLGRIGLDAAPASGATEGALLLREAIAAGHPYDAVLVDLAADDDGLAAVAALHADVALASAAVLLVTTAHRPAGGGELDGRVAEGIHGYLTRPVRMRQLQPVLLSVLGRATEPREPAREAPPSRDDVHLLLAEDNPVNRTVVVHTLRRLGYEVQVVTNGEEALSAMAAQPFDMVLMDCQMPVRDGYSATRELRRREGDARHTPIVALTAAAMTADRDRCVAAGMDDYLTKPVRANELDAALQRWLPAPRAAAGVDATTGPSPQPEQSRPATPLAPAG